MSVYVIAEAGVNHNGSFELACELANAAKDAGADAVKFQTFKADALVTPNARASTYQRINSDTDKGQYEMLKELELAQEDFIELEKYCKSIDIDFCTTAFDPESTEFAISRLSLPFLKVPSGEITNLPFLEVVGETGKPVLLSTGMSSYDEVDEAVSVLKSFGSKEIVVLHCTTQYPAPYKDVNLSAMVKMGNRLGLPYGYSDHTIGEEISVSAVALGACVIEKHFTLDRSMDGPDHKASTDPKGLEKLVSRIRHVEESMGDGIKAVNDSELENRDLVRKSIVANTRIDVGEVFTIENLAVKRPGTGISPMRWHEIIGQRAKRSFEANEMIEL